ncbi:MAG: rhombosortase [Proteobacteria bacterium]|nr:rhombosortase [Pseudomonadota bacterium]
MAVVAPKAAGFPVVTLLVAAGGLALMLLPDIAHMLVYDRERVLAGEVWRLATGHAVHFSWSHAAWNLTVFSVVGVWLERRDGARYLWLIAVMALASGLWFLTVLPDMARYGGLSGLISAMVVYLALTELRQPGPTRAIWATILLLFVAKLVYELLSGQAIFVAPDAIPFQVAPAAHIVGAVVAIFQIGVLEGRIRHRLVTRLDLPDA